MKDKIREIIEMHDSLVEYNHGREHCILPQHYDELADEIYKLFNSAPPVEDEVPIICSKCGNRIK